MKKKEVSVSNYANSFEIKQKFELTEKQKIFIETGLSKECKSIFCDGIWGTSKSYLATLVSLNLLSQKRINGVIYVRNPVESSTTSKLGAIPGLISEKMAPYNQIFFDKLQEFLSKSQIDLLLKENKLSCIPLGFTRGLSWSGKAVIVDEAASMTYDDLILLLSRCAEHTKIFFIGDSINQNDIGKKSGFKKMFDLLSDEESRQNGVFTFEFNKEEDVLRSGFVRFIMKKTGKIKF